MTLSRNPWGVAAAIVIAYVAGRIVGWLKPEGQADD